MNAEMRQLRIKKHILIRTIKYLQEERLHKTGSICSKITFERMYERLKDTKMGMTDL